MQYPRWQQVFSNGGGQASSEGFLTVTGNEFLWMVLLLAFRFDRRRRVAAAVVSKKVTQKIFVTVRRPCVSLTSFRQL
jgi:hypothetical protein